MPNPVMGWLMRGAREGSGWALVCWPAPHAPNRWSPPLDMPPVSKEHACVLGSEDFQTDGLVIVCWVVASEAIAPPGSIWMINSSYVYLHGMFLICMAFFFERGKWTSPKTDLYKTISWQLVLLLWCHFVLF